MTIIIQYGSLKDVREVGMSGPSRSFIYTNPWMKTSHPQLRNRFLPEDLIFTWMSHLHTVELNTSDFAT